MGSSRIKKFDELTKEIQKTIQEAQDRLLNAIIDDPELSKVDKLSLISDNNLFKTLSWIQDVFKPYKEEYIDIVKKNPLYTRSYDPIIDDYFQHREYSRHETVNLAEMVEYMDEEDDELITIFTNRTTKDVFKISKYEFIDTVYDWCIANKAIAFEIDW
jgi:succinate dehydrogenase flavin-adding protein (antitoxin of CptAB toxin-antitoxin module)